VVGRLPEGGHIHNDAHRDLDHDHEVEQGSAPGFQIPPAAGNLWRA